jgi:hypothetical protein
MSDPKPNKTKKSLTKTLGAAALATILFSAGAGAGYVGSKYKLEPKIAAAEQQVKDQQKENDHLKNDNEFLREILLGHKKPLIFHVLEELRSHPPADEEIERILSARINYVENITLPLRICCQSEYETITKEFAEYKQTHDKDLGLRIYTGILWLNKRCSMKIEQ